MINSYLSHYQQQQLNHIMYSNDAGDAIANRNNNNQLKNIIVDAQRIYNYTGNCEPIRNRADNSAAPALNRDGLAARAEHLNAMGACAVDTIC